MRKAGKCLLRTRINVLFLFSELELNCEEVFIFLIFLFFFLLTPLSIISKGGALFDSVCGLEVLYVLSAPPPYEEKSSSRWALSSVPFSWFFCVFFFY